MPSSDRSLLLVDAVANLVLGAVLLAFPLGIGRPLGLPAAASGFYPSLLGAVLVGIGIALLLARTGRPGLGLEGAIVINTVGAGVLVVWLIESPPSMSLRGSILLWSVAVTVFAIGSVELIHRRRADDR